MYILEGLRLCACTQLFWHYANGILLPGNDFYFRFHHSNADYVSVFDKDDIKYTAAIFAVLAHNVANLEDWWQHEKTLTRKLPGTFLLRHVYRTLSCLIWFLRKMLAPHLASCVASFTSAALFNACSVQENRVSSTLFNRSDICRRAVRELNDHLCVYRISFTYVLATMGFSAYFSPWCLLVNAVDIVICSK